MHHAYSHHRTEGCQPVPYYVPVCMHCGMPAQACCCASHAPATPQRSYRIHEEVSAAPDAPEKMVLVGGVAPAKGVLEYILIDGAESPSVTLAVTGPDGTIMTIAESPVPAGFQVKEDIAAFEPGTIIKLSVAGCLARLRWLEKFNY